MSAAAWRAGLRELVDLDDLLEEPADCWPYGADNSRRHHPPEAVVFARAPAQVRDLVRFCRDRRVALTARGLGTNTTGAAVPVRGGIVLSTERMNRLLELDPEERCARVEPGLLNQELQDAAAAHGLLWGPDPSSAPFCTVGGNLACNAAGPRALRYGTARDNTLRLRAVTGAGELLTAGSAARKSVVGLDLLRLLIGSEGTLAVFTEATLLLRPRPPARVAARAVFADERGAAALVRACLAEPEAPAALEFLDAACLDLVRGDDALELPPTARALLLLELDGAGPELPARTARLERAARDCAALDFRAAEDEAERAALWQARRTLSPALRRLAPEKINEDVAVPPSRLGELLAALEELRAGSAVPIVCFGHAGSGNLHVNLLPDGGAAQRTAARALLDRVFDAVLKLGGTLSGEHGVGLAKRDYIARELDPAALGLMRAIKDAFDPDGILNPDKNLPPADAGTAPRPPP